MSRQIRLTDADLDFLFAWVETYEGDDDDADNMRHRDRLIQWSREEGERREVARIQKRVHAQTGKRPSVSLVRKTLSEMRNKK